MSENNRGAPACRRFELIRTEDETGVSGNGVVAYGVIFPDGRAVLRWDTKVNSTVFYDSLDDLKAIHGHGGKTRVVPIDYPYPSADYASVWTELRGYVQQAAADSSPIDPADLLRYLDELRRRALAPVDEWMKRTGFGRPDTTGETP
jgi:hypothetical protein